MIKVAVLDDQNMFLEGICALLGNIDEIHVSNKFLKGAELIDSIEQLTADVVLLDINLPDVSGLKVLEAIKSKRPEIGTLMLSMHNDFMTVKEAVSLGADGYLLKNSTKIEFEKAIKTIADGKSYFTEEIKDVLIDVYRSKNTVQSVRLTSREKEVLRLLCNEQTTQEISEKLFISIHTVESHRKNLMTKIGAKNIVGLVKFALENNLN